MQEGLWPTGEGRGRHESPFGRHGKPCTAHRMVRGDRTQKRPSRGQRYKKQVIDPQLYSKESTSDLALPGCKLAPSLPCERTKHPETCRNYCGKQWARGFWGIVASLPGSDIFQSQMALKLLKMAPPWGVATFSNRNSLPSYIIVLGGSMPRTGE